MFDDGARVGGADANDHVAGAAGAADGWPSGDGADGALSPTVLNALKIALAAVSERADAGARVDRIRALSELKNAVAAAEAQETALFMVEQRSAVAGHNDEATPRADAAAGVRSGSEPDPAGETARARARAAADRSLSGQVGLARRCSPFHARRYCGWAVVLTAELPATFAQLQAGRVTEWRAMIMARETAWLSRADRGVVDAALAPHLAGWGDARVEAAVKTLAYQLDPAGFMARVRGAHADRGVSVRPAPDVMARLSALLPAAQGIAAHLSLAREADRLRALGDPRSRRQIMADTLVERLTGQASADDVPVEIELIMTDSTLFGHADVDVDVDADIGADSHVGVRETATETERSEDGRSETEQPETEQPETEQPETEQPEAEQPEAEQPEAEQLKAESTPAAANRFETGGLGAGGLKAGSLGAGSVGAGGGMPGLLIGYGPIPAELARELALGRRPTTSEAGVTTAKRTGTRARSDMRRDPHESPRWIRRLYAHPDTGDLIGMDSRRRFFPSVHRRFIRLRDHGICRTPWCDAPIRHTDHIRAHTDGGRTSIANGEGLCEACNLRKQSPGWRSHRLGSGASPDIAITTPTGHTYLSPTPRPPNQRPNPAALAAYRPVNLVYHSPDEAA